MIQSEDIDDNTNQKEYAMIWKKNRGFQIPVDIPLILGNLITIIFDYQILRKPLKTLSL